MIKSNLIFNVFLEILAMSISSIYLLVTGAIWLVFEIAEFELVNDTVVETLSQRIYVVLAIFMLFKVAFSLLNGVINPDSLTDKQSGMGKIVSRTMIALCGLMLFPSIYDMAIDYQPELVNVVARVIVGSESNSLAGGNAAGVGETMAATAFASFMSPNDNCPEGEDNAAPDVHGGLSSLVQQVSATCSNKYYRFDWNFLICAVVGIILAVILIFFCIDVAVRTLKLLVLRVIAPIAIISYIDPKSEKNGAFGSWFKMLISTYIQLFVIMGSLYLALFFIAQLMTLRNIGSTVFQNPFAFAFILVGILFFAQQAPKFIANALGIKDFGGSIGLAGIMGGAAALVGGAGLSGAAVSMLGGMSDAASAAAQGKSAPSAWNTGRDLAAQLRTGDNKARGGMINALGRKAQMKAEEKAADRMGYIGQKETDLENLVAQDNADLAAKQMAYDLAESDFSAMSDPGAAPVPPNIEQPTMPDAYEYDSNDPASAAAFDEAMVEWSAKKAEYDQAQATYESQKAYYDRFQAAKEKRDHAREELSTATANVNKSKEDLERYKGKRGKFVATKNVSKIDAKKRDGDYDTSRLR